MPFHHIAIRVSDVNKSREFYDPVMAAAGYVVYWANNTIVYYAPIGSPKAFEFGLMLSNPDKPAAKSHIAFALPSIDEVVSVYNIAIESGGTDNGQPGFREKINKDYYGAFVLDCDGNNIEFIHFVRE
ncbi:Glyoxalase/Bleomycin resistance protein/Dihydroxybiphenyl dioxygenase [Lipomyces orientalis]|uniref:Glyoxalase/Bleomycin resistance protein/Dihydroxybiphenyl dioxygenase n=1 Tax=Lipomyces orientalis TaxID=1233043 RepID=A0ACC3TF85_9ASCO